MVCTISKSQLRRLSVGAVLLWPGAIAIGLSLGLLGSGGSILTVPVLLYLVGQDEKVAIAGSLAIVGLIAVIGSFSFLRERLVHWRSVWLFGVPGMVGTYIGAWSSAFVGGALQLSVFSIVMIIAAFFMLRPIQPPTGIRAVRPFWQIGIEGLAVGSVTGFVGVGGGFLIVPALVVLGGLSMHRAVATSLIIIALKSAVGFLKYREVLAADGLSLDYDIIGVVTILGVAGSFTGAHVGKRLPTDTLQRGFGAFLVVMGIYIFARSGLGLFG